MTKKKEIEKSKFYNNMLKLFHKKIHNICITGIIRLVKSLHRNDLNELNMTYIFFTHPV